MKISIIGQLNKTQRKSFFNDISIQFATQLFRKGQQVTVYRKGNKNRAGNVFNGFKVRNISMYSSIGSLFSYTLAVVKSCVIDRVDVIHFYGSIPSVLSWMPKFLRPQVTVFSTFGDIERNNYRGTIFRVLSKIGEKNAVKFSDSIIVTEKFLQNYFELTYKKRPEYLSFGIQSRRVAVSDIILNQRGLRSFGYICTTNRELNDESVERAVSIWKGVKDKLQNKMVLVGDTNNVSEEIKMKLQQDGSIVLLGMENREVLDALYAGARFVFSVDNTVNKNAVLEAMSYGKVVLLSELQNTPELFSDYCVMCGTDIVAMSQKIYDSLKDPINIASLGHQCRVFVEEEFNWEVLSEDLIEIYEKHAMLRDGVLAIW